METKGLRFSGEHSWAVSHASGTEAQACGGGARVGGGGGGGRPPFPVTFSTERGGAPHTGRRVDGPGQRSRGATRNLGAVTPSSLGRGAPGRGPEKLHPLHVLGVLFLALLFCHPLFLRLPGSRLRKEGQEKEQMSGPKGKVSVGFTPFSLFLEETRCPGHV